MVMNMHVGMHILLAAQHHAQPAEACTIMFNKPCGMAEQSSAEASWTASILPTFAALASSCADKAIAAACDGLLTRLLSGPAQHIPIQQCLLFDRAVSCFKQSLAVADVGKANGIESIAERRQAVAASPGSTISTIQKRKQSLGKYKHIHQRGAHCNSCAVDPA